MAHHNKIRPDLPSEVPNLFSGLTSHQLCRGVQTQLPQPGDALVKYVAYTFSPSRLIRPMIDLLASAVALRRPDRSREG